MGARILVIEDNAANLQLMTYLLKAYGHVALTATDGREGLEAARRERPHLVLCDVQLPVMDGLEVARAMKQDAALRDIPLVAVTALAMVGDRDRILAAGFDGYVPKPLDPENFVRQVEVFLEDADRSTVALPEATPTAGTLRVELETRATILVVDDMKVNRELIRSTLEPVGFKVVLAESVGQAMALARQARPDLILTDLQMPVETGLDLLKAVATDRQLAGVPVVCITASAWGSQERDKALSLGAVRFILRPIEPEHLISEIERCLQSCNRLTGSAKREGG